ncbi:BAH domain protein [Ceratobasidium sp. AG-Ba]|nr:BAH domain protein [Ceratobasidium sp. AG-Ba]
MPPSRKKTKYSKSYATLIDNDKKLSYFRSRLKTVVKSASVNGKEIRSGQCVVIDIIEDDSGSSTTDDVCIAQVQELRTDDSKDTEVYVLVRWFYTVLQRLSKSSPCVENLSNRSFSPRELILSDHEQVFSLSQLLDKVTVRIFSENVPDQPAISATEWWYRCFWPTKQKTLLTAGHTKVFDARWGELATKKVTRHIRTSSTFVPVTHAAAGPPASPLVRILHGTPGFEMLDLGEDGVDTKFFERVKISEQFIGGIVACAQHSVMRGKKYGVVGNFNAVKRARELLIEARQQDLWPSDAEIKEFAKWERPEEIHYKCKDCGGAI